MALPELGSDCCTGAFLITLSCAMVKFALPAVKRTLATSRLPRSGSFDRELALKKSMIHLGKEIRRYKPGCGDARHNARLAARTPHFFAGISRADEARGAAVTSSGEPLWRHGTHSQSPERRP